MAHLPRIEEPYGLNIREARGREVLPPPFGSPTNEWIADVRAEQLARAVERELNQVNSSRC